MPLLTPLTPDQRTTFIVVTLPVKTLRKLVGRLGTAPTGTRIDGMAVWDLAWSLVDYYENDTEVAAAVDRTLEREVGASPLAGAIAAPDGSQSVTDLLLASKDPARDLAWALLTGPGGDDGALAARCVQTIIADFDAADERARQEESAAGAQPAPAESTDPTAELLREKEREAKKASTSRARALKRLDAVRERVVELEQALAGARRDLRTEQDARARVVTERDRLQEEREQLRGRLHSGTAGEVERLREELETVRRRVRSLEGEVDEARDAEQTATARLRALEQAASTRPSGGGPEEAPAAGGPGWYMPIFTDEFYESIRRWDRKIVHNAFEKIHRLAEDWRHPSLRAIPLEGLPGCFRIRVATDVRLIYRPLEGNRIEVMSLIDREDLQRYIRQAKTRVSS
ncbi:MAG: hypothetical protein KIT14_11095 [bacterium]|nr:hypothetical protein [bacterium]